MKAAGNASPWLLERRAHFDELVGRVEEYAIFMMSPEGIVLDWNRGAQLLKGYLPDEIIGRNFSSFYSEEDLAKRIPEQDLEDAARRGKFVTEGWRYRKDGTRFWASVTITAITSPGGGVEGFLKITRDLTERQLSLEQLRQSEERIRLLIESVSEYAIFMLDPGGHVRSWNSGARRIKGYEEKEIIGQHFSKFYTPEALDDGLPGRLLNKALEEGSAEDEGWRVRKDGSRFWGNVLITAVHDSHGTHRGFVKITRDQTARRHAEQLQKSSSRKDTFLATLAHELRNPLAPMLPAVEILLRAPHDTGRVVQVSSMLRRQVDQMSRLIEDLVDLSRITTGRIALKRKRTNLAGIVERAVEATRPLMERKNHRFGLVLPPIYVEVDADEHRLIQALSNLLGNAAKYTPDGGEILLTARLADRRTVELSVKDNGRGISEGEMESIFDLFDQGSHGSEDGLGIGLTLVRTIAELHGGETRVRSDGAGQGSEFTLSLPIVISPAGEERAATDADAVPAPRIKARVLIADDGKNTADMLAIFFQLDGMETAVAYDGEQAVAMAASFKPDIVCLDLGMPVLDGYGAAERIRSMFPDTMLLALSGWGAEADRRKSREAGFDAHLVKPVNPEDLRVMIRKKFPLE